MTVALVYRGTAENVKKFLDRQDEYFLDPDRETEEETDKTEKAGERGEDIVERANDIINGNADYYDVEEEINNG